MMDAIILVGGKGTRLRSVVSDRPKPLAEVNGYPFLDYLIRQIEPHVSTIILAVGYMGDQVALHYSDRCLISREEKPLGTGGAVVQAIDQVQGERFWILNGDSFFDIDFGQMEQISADLVMACRHVEDVSRYGSVEIKQGRVKAFHEKREASGSGWINGGIYIVNRSLFKDYERGEALSLEHDFFPELLLSDKQVMAYSGAGKFIDIGTPESYQEASALLIGEENC